MTPLEAFKNETSTLDWEDKTINQVKQSDRRLKNQSEKEKKNVFFES